MIVRFAGGPVRFLETRDITSVEETLVYPSRPGLGRSVPAFERETEGVCVTLRDRRRYYLTNEQAQPLLAVLNALGCQTEAMLESAEV